MICVDWKPDSVGADKVGMLQILLTDFIFRYIEFIHLKNIPCGK